jgi:hypothetical protein
MFPQGQSDEAADFSLTNPLSTALPISQLSISLGSYRSQSTRQAVKPSSRHNIIETAISRFLHEF